MDDEPENMDTIRYNNKELIIDGLSVELEYSIDAARIINNLVVVIYKFDSTVPTDRQFNNCQAFDSNGKLVWTAEHPTDFLNDSYTNFIKSDNIKLGNFAGFTCQLNFKNGKLIKTDFTK